MFILLLFISSSNCFIGDRGHTNWVALTITLTFLFCFSFPFVYLNHSSRQSRRPESPRWSQPRGRGSPETPTAYTPRDQRHNCPCQRPGEKEGKEGEGEERPQKRTRHAAQQHRRAAVEPVWTKYFQLAHVAKEEEDWEEEDEVKESDKEAVVEVMPQRGKSSRPSSISEGENEWNFAW